MEFFRRFFQKYPIAGAVTNGVLTVGCGVTTVGVGYFTFYSSTLIDSFVGKLSQGFIQSGPFFVLASMIMISPFVYFTYRSLNNSIYYSRLAYRRFKSID